LATRAHDIELNIAVVRNSLLPIQKSKRNKGHKFMDNTLRVKGKNTPKVKGKQSLIINPTVIKISTSVKRNDYAKPTTS